MTKYRFGFDVGTSSLGWSVLALDADDKPCAVVNAGSRIFSEGRNPKSKATLAATRREARLARRGRDRFQQRQQFLLRKLTKAGLFPDVKDKERLELQTLDPLELRAKALTEELPPYHIGRALFHINQRRGFQSNRKDTTKETTSGMVAESVKKLLVEMELMEKGLSNEECKTLNKEQKADARHVDIRNKNKAFRTLAVNGNITFGAFLWKLRSRREATRARPNADGKLYDFYPTRQMLDDEFGKIWRAQAAYYPDILTDRLYKLLHKIIFNQRPLKPQERGFCAYFPAEKRAFRAMPSFQRYRMYQEVNNLMWSTAEGTRQLVDYPAARDEIIQLLERPTNQAGTLTFGAMKKVLKKLNLAEGNFKFNLETEKRKGLYGNLTTHLMQKDEFVGSEWHDWNEDKQDAFVDLLLDDYKDDEEVLEILSEEYGMTGAAAEHYLGGTSALQQGVASLSGKAAKLMIEIMRSENLKQHEAATKIGSDRQTVNELQAKLPYYGEAFFGRGHIVPGDGNKAEYEKHGNDLKYYGGITNPTVHIALNQIRVVVNELIDRYGHPASIAIELARDLPLGAKGRKELESEQTKNQEANKKRDKKLIEMKRTVNKDNRLRLKLWQELEGGLCVFSGERIGLSDLFSDKVEIEHLIPFHFSLDDSNANKVVCLRKANRDKGGCTPHQAFSNHPNYRWADIHDRATQLPASKRWRFQENALDIWKRDHDNFLGRHLNDTRYIGRMAKDYLACICSPNKIDVLTGRLTALLRGHWGLNSVLRVDSEMEESSSDKPVKKNREDHRHHAVDAIVIGMTTRSILQKVATVSEQTGGDAGRLFSKSAKNKSGIDPYDGFRQEALETISKIVVSHRSKRKMPAHLSMREKPLQSHGTTGQLHIDTAYGVISEPIKEYDGREVYPKLVVRWPIDKFKTEKDLKGIRDPVLREVFISAYQDGEKTIQELARDKGIRRLRCIEEKVPAIAIKNKQGKVYKALKTHGNWATEIYEYPAGHEKVGQWESFTITIYEANKTKFRPGVTKRPHPAAKLIMRLQIDDCVQLDGYSQPMRLQKMSPGRLIFSPVLEANVAQRNTDKDNDFSFFGKAISTLKKLNARKIHISPTGLISAEKRRRPNRKI